MHIYDWRRLYRRKRRHRSYQYIWELHAKEEIYCRELWKGHSNVSLNVFNTALHQITVSCIGLASRTRMQLFAQTQHRFGGSIGIHFMVLPKQLEHSSGLDVMLTKLFPAIDLKLNLIQLAVYVQAIDGVDIAKNISFNGN